MKMEEKKMKFESSMERLEQIVRALESGDMGLEESLKLYEEGITLVRSCNETLEQAEIFRLANPVSVFAGSRF